MNKSVLSRKNNYIKRAIVSLIISSSFLVNSCMAYEKKPLKQEISAKVTEGIDSVTHTIEDYFFFFSNISDYYGAYNDNFGKEYKRKAKDLSNLEKVMLLDSISNSYFVYKRKEPEADDYEKMQGFIQDVGESAFRKTFDEAFKSSGIVIGDSEKEPVSFGVRPSIIDRKVGLRYYAKVKNINLLLFQFSSGRIELGANLFKLRLISPLKDEWYAQFSYSLGNSNPKKESDLALSLIRPFGENARFTITAGYGDGFLKDDENRSGFYLALNYIKKI